MSRDLILVNQTGLMRREEIQSYLNYPIIQVKSNVFNEQDLDKCCKHKVFKPVNYGHKLKPEFERQSEHVFYACGKTDELLDTWLTRLRDQHGDAVSI